MWLLCVTNPQSPVQSEGVKRASVNVYLRLHIYEHKLKPLSEENSFSKKHKRMERIPQKRGSWKEGSTSMNKSGIDNDNTKLVCRYWAPCDMRTP